MGFEKVKSMRELEIKKEDENEVPSELYLRAMKLRPTQSASNEKEVTKLNARLESIAKKLGLSVEKLLIEAETSRTFKEEYIEALSVSRQITFLKK